MPTEDSKGTDSKSILEQEQREAAANAFTGEVLERASNEVKHGKVPSETLANYTIPIVEHDNAMLHGGQEECVDSAAASKPLSKFMRSRLQESSQESEENASGSQEEEPPKRMSKFMMARRGIA